MRLAVSKERTTGERRVALVPETVARLCKQGHEVWIEEGAGATSYFTDNAYTDSGARVVDDPKALFNESDVLLKVQPPSADEAARYGRSLVVVGFMRPHENAEAIAVMKDRGVTAFAVELIPRITRAQAMDALSSQGTVAGYKAALMAADLCPRFFPMLTTAAGTMRPSKVLVLGAGVAGLQAIATARRLGAVVEAYDVRHAAREQVESLGAKFLQVELDAEAEGGYARELTDDEKEREQAMLFRSVGQADVVITTAQIPGRPAPRLISARMVEQMKPGAVVVDLAAETGGNCELSRAGERFEHFGITIYGPVNVPSMLPVHASEMYAKNLSNFVGVLRGDEGELQLNWDDEILANSILTHDGEIRYAPARERIEGGRE